MGPHHARSPSGLPDIEIERLAEQLARAMAAPRPDDPREDILARRFELPPEDEERVIAALAALRAAR